jgi:2-succinyl-5-enolpyruvyl-6-hydroxy-3-cyclohexene-1-carboxylate synthase
VRAQLTASAHATALGRFVGCFVDSLAAAGLRHVSLCPGSRSTPLALLLRRHPDVRVWTHLDERSAGFFALGQAKALREPVALLSTSGTAAVTFAPAVVEAFYGRVPLVVLTADRPPELRGVGANQTIDQVRLYGTHVKLALELPLPDAAPMALRHARDAARRALAVAAEAPAGPVQVNLPLREPLLPADEPHGLRIEAGRPWQAPRRPRAADVAPLATALKTSPRGLIVCGPQDATGFAEAVSRLAGVLGYPLLADTLSQVRCGPHHGPLVIDAHDTLLRDEAVASALAPDVVLRFGAAPTSKTLLGFLEDNQDARQVIVDEGDWRDPLLVATDAVRADPTAFCDALVEALGEPLAGDPARREWAAAWQEASCQARASLEAELAGDGGLSEPAVFGELSRLLPEGAVLFAGNSMPVRDLDCFFPGGSTGVRFFANRGASGIDGVVSTALGATAAGARPLVLVIGDLSFYHDMNGLLAVRRHDLDATIVLLNNDGGGIFSLLPQAEEPEHFEELFGTPHGLDFRHAAAMYGLRHHIATDRDDFRAAVRRSLAAPGVDLIEVRTDRAANADLHRRLWAEAAAAARGA